jgi:hypothetical protein
MLPKGHEQEKARQYPTHKPSILTDAPGDDSDEVPRTIAAGRQ